MRFPVDAGGLKAFPGEADPPMIELRNRQDTQAVLTEDNIFFHTEHRLNPKHHTMAGLYQQDVLNAVSWESDKHRWTVQEHIHSSPSKDKAGG